MINSKNSSPLSNNSSNEFNSLIGTDANNTIEPKYSTYHENSFIASNENENYLNKKKSELFITVPPIPKVFNMPTHLMSSTESPSPHSISDTYTANFYKNQQKNTQTNETEQNFSSMQPPSDPFVESNSKKAQSSNNSDWIALPSPLESQQSSFNIYSPFLYSPLNWKK